MSVLVDSVLFESDLVVTKLVESRLKQCVEEHAVAVQTRGYTVLESLLTAEHTEALVNKLNQIFEHERSFGTRDKWENPKSQISYVLPIKGTIFRDLCRHPELLCLARQLLGTDCIIDVMNGFAVYPGAQEQKLHVDWKAEGASLASIACLFVLDDFRRENGCTRIVPFSHNQRFVDGEPYDADNATQFDHFEGKAVYVEAPAGSVIVYNNTALHAAGTNQTDLPRRSIHLQFCRSWVRPACDLPEAMHSMSSALAPEEFHLFGFDLAPPLKYNKKTADYTQRTAIAHRLWCYAEQAKTWLLSQDLMQKLTSKF